MLNYPHGTYGPPHRIGRVAAYWWCFHHYIYVHSVYIVFLYDKESPLGLPEDPQSAHKNSLLVRSDNGKVVIQSAWVICSVERNNKFHPPQYCIDDNTCFTMPFLRWRVKIIISWERFPTRRVRLESINALWRDCYQRCNIMEGEPRDSAVEKCSYSV